MNLLEDLKKPLLNFSFIMIYTINKIFVLIKNHLNYLQDNIFECFFKKYNRLFFFKTILFSWYIIMESLSLEEENLIKDIRNLFRQEKDTKVIKHRDFKNLSEHEKEEEIYYKPVTVSNFWSNNYIEYESNKVIKIKHY